eukprot:6132339-Lingulodinium_polyedra.AAC.1
MAGVCCGFLGQGHRNAALLGLASFYADLRPGEARSWSAPSRSTASSRPSSSTSWFWRRSRTSNQARR